ncbi:hypothetical protein [Thermoactinomyces mirandus]|uniref:Uncharacterized protein n=1 Tax=Thermoactinomyces mirandus TaxID=2756294 RepID=A0A7W2ARU4_9BACL|nr:hypothetical protein [Thermoactinomyces mirandus]MBA4601970.1 hypothetical protein [Thermoactinomyces mirandus]
MNKQMILIIFLIFIIFMVTLAAYILPIGPQYVLKLEKDNLNTNQTNYPIKSDQDKEYVINTETSKADHMANQIAYLNFLLTFLAMLGTVLGLAFALYGYYQTEKVPKLVKKYTTTEIKNLEDKVKEITEELQDTISNSLKALICLSERSIK